MVSKEDIDRLDALTAKLPVVFCGRCATPYELTSAKQGSFSFCPRCGCANAGVKLATKKSR